MDELENVSMGCKCGKCGGDIYFHTCPIHHNALKSECLRCKQGYVVQESCDECGFRLTEPREG